MNLRLNNAVTNLFQLSEKHPVLAWSLSVVWLVAIALLAFLWNLGNIGLVDETEPLFAEAARQMNVTGNWITPYFNGETRFDKPPLIYWLMAIAYRCLGVNEWAVRFPSALAAIGLMGLGFYTLRYFGVYPSSQNLEPTTSDRASLPQSKQLWLSAWLGAAMIALNPQTIAWARTGVSDMLLTGCMCSALLAFFIAYAEPEPQRKSRWYLAFYVLASLAVLTKGPVGIVLPGLVISLFLLYLGNWRAVLQEMQLFWGSIVFLLISVPWYVLVIGANGQKYINSFFGYHNLERFTSVVNNHSAPWFFYFLVVPIAFAPWSVYLPLAIVKLRFWNRSYWCNQPRSSQLGLFSLFWIAVIFGFFTIAVTKLPSYVLPVMPGTAILVALLWSDRLTHSPTTEGVFSGFKISGIFTVVTWLIVSGTIWAITSHPRWIDNDPAMPNLDGVLAQSHLLLIGGLLTLAIAIGCLILLISGGQDWLWSANFLGLTAFLIFAITPAYFVMDSQRQLPLRQLAQLVVQIKQPGEELMMIGFEKPSLVFYTQQPVEYFRQPDPAIQSIKKNLAHAPHPDTILILSYNKRFLDLGLQPDQYQTIKVTGAYKLVRVPQQVIANLAKKNVS